MMFWKCRTCLKWNHESTCYRCGKHDQVEMPEMWKVGPSGNGQGMQIVQGG